MPAIEPFEIEIPDEALSDLHARIDNTRWPTALDGVGWSQGTDPVFLRSLIDDWRKRYDWRAQEKALNALPHYRTAIEGLDLHFLHQPGKGSAPLPLVLSHGWPSTFVEYAGLIDALSDPGAHGGDPADAFHVVVPSLPGYGFSAQPTRRGMTPRAIARIWVELMRRLGYERFGAHGCDWGSYVTALLGHDHPEHLAGIHMGMVSLGVPSSGQREKSPEEEAFRARGRAWAAEESGYQQIQGTKPQTLTYGLTDSPVGLAAWVAEKWRAWSDCGGDLYTAIDRDTVLTNIAIYWFTGTIGSASRLYYESRHAPDPVVLAPGERINVPSGFFLERPPEAELGEGSDRSQRDAPRVGAPPRERVEPSFDIQRWFVAPTGGHFPALETPELLIDELRAFFRPLRDA
jgi:pimeloyl-ACP methyl ester carboxylesterase